METNIALLVAILIVLILLFLTVLAYLTYSGLFTNIDVKAGKPPYDNIQLAYKFARGCYRNCGQLFTETYNIVPQLKCIGVYYDDQDEVEPHSLRYLVGAVLDENSETNEETLNLLRENGYNFATFPAVDNAVMVKFPYRGTLSVMIAVGRVYPQLRNYIKEHKLHAYPFVEIYDGKEILFMAPLDRQEEFFVKEALEESDEELEAAPDQGAQGDITTQTEPTEKESEMEQTLNIENLKENVQGSQVQEIQPADTPSDLHTDNGKSGSNGSEASTESFEELQLDS